VGSRRVNFLALCEWHPQVISLMRVAAALYVCLAETLF
jgi:hypothetical protein